MTYKNLCDFQRWAIPSLECSPLGELEKSCIVFQEVLGQAKVIDPAQAGLDTPVKPFDLKISQF
ncbi:MAG: hypothetical protein AMJ89_02190 [candidate division Zixibacteria bacterium SM23_73]|nr:MAG: hypothetical protein AMJ89_02190 [candidate division Zixibacteria bacterium SM23_73]